MQTWIKGKTTVRQESWQAKGGNIPEPVEIMYQSQPEAPVSKLKAGNKLQNGHRKQSKYGIEADNKHDS